MLGRFGGSIRDRDPGIESQKSTESLFTGKDGQLLGDVMVSASAAWKSQTSDPAERQSCIGYVELRFGRRSSGSFVARETGTQE